MASQCSFIHSPNIYSTPVSCQARSSTENTTVNRTGKIPNLLEHIFKMREWQLEWTANLRANKVS